MYSALLEDPETFITTFYRYQDGNVTSRYLSDDLCRFLDQTPKGIEKCPRFNITQDQAVAEGSVRKVTHNNNLLALKTSIIYKTVVEYRTSPPESIRRLAADLDRSRYTCGLSSETLLNSVYVGLDKFSNEVIASQILFQIMLTFPIPAFITYYGSSLCPFNPSSLIGVHLMEYADLGRLDQFSRKIGDGEYHYLKKIILSDSTETTYDLIKPPVLLEIFKQLLLTLKYLSPYRFTHGKLLISKILLSSAPIDTIYEGHEVKLGFTVKISDYDKVSLTFPINGREHRFYNRHQIADLYLRDASPYSIWTGDYDGQPYYILRNLDANRYTILRYMGVPFYPEFDIYTLFISILAAPNFYYSLEAEPKLLSWLVNALWFPEDRTVMVNRFKNKDPIEMETIIKCLLGVRLKCNLLDELIRTLPK